MQHEYLPTIQLLISFSSTSRLNVLSKGGQSFLLSFCARCCWFVGWVESISSTHFFCCCCYNSSLIHRYIHLICRSFPNDGENQVNVDSFQDRVYSLDRLPTIAYIIKSSRWLPFLLVPFMAHWEWMAEQMMMTDGDGFFLLKKKVMVAITHSPLHCFGLANTVYLCTYNINGDLSNLHVTRVSNWQIKNFSSLSLY